MYDISWSSNDSRITKNFCCRMTFLCLIAGVVLSARCLVLPPPPGRWPNETHGTWMTYVHSGSECLLQWMLCARLNWMANAVAVGIGRWPMPTTKNSGDQRPKLLLLSRGWRGMVVGPGFGCSLFPIGRSVNIRRCCRFNRYPSSFFLRLRLARCGSRSFL